MRIRKHLIDEPPARGVGLHRRMFASLLRDDETEIFGGHLEVIARKPKREFSARFHVGGAWSETPFDGHLTIAGTGFYWGINNGRALADRITRERTHKYEGRDISCHTYGSRFHWSLWVHGGTWQRGEFAKWRNGSIKTSLLDHVLGESKYAHEDLAAHTLVIAMPEDTYRVHAKLQRQTLGRPRSKRKTHTWCVDVDAPKGIPNRYDPSGGWKGDRVYGFAVTLPGEPRSDWWVDALNAITARIYSDRARYGFRKAQEVDS